MKYVISEQEEGRQLSNIYGDNDRITTIFYIFVISILVGLTAGFFIVLTTGNVVSALFILTGLLAAFFSLLLIRRKKFESAAVFLAVMLMVLNTILSTRGVGIHNISNIAYPVILIIASMVVNKRKMVVLTFSTVLCIAWLVFGELSGLYTPTVLVRSVPGDFFSAALIVVFTAIMMYRVTDTLFQSLFNLQDEIKERQVIEGNLRQREAILESATNTAEQFLRSTDWRDVIDDVLEKMGRTLGASHAYLFERHPGPDGKVLSSMQYEWTAPGQTSDLDGDIFRNIDTDEPGFERYYEILNRGDPLIGSTSFFTSEEQDYWNSIGIKSILEMRIIVEDKQWGAIGFDDMVNEREWTAPEVDLIKVAANVLGAAIKRQLDEDALRIELAVRRRAEHALRFSEEKFSKAFHATQILMTIENEGRFIEINKAFQDAINLPRDQIIGHSAGELNIFYDLDDSKVLQRQMEEKGYVRDLEIRFRRANGQVGSALLSSENFSVDGVEYLLTSGLDISEFKKIQENYRSIFENSIEGIFQCNTEGRYLSVNPAMARIFGYASPDNMIDQIKDFRTQVYADSAVWSEVRSMLDDGKKLSAYELRNLRNDGTEFWASMSAQAINDVDGNLLYYEGSIEDISDRKQADADRDELIDELARKNSELEQFTYTVSHDLKSPLVTINGFLGYLEEDVKTGNRERLKIDAQRIKDAVLKMQKLLNELLELSRIGRMMNSPERVPFEELVREAIDNVRGRLNEKGIVVHTLPDLPDVYGDRPRLVEVMQNLIDNAAKYMGDQKNPRIEIGFLQKDEAYTYFVKDNGIGIDSEHYDRIFGLFNKLDPESEGTGVGLSLVKRIIEVHEGSVWVESELGQGSTFFFTVPARPPD